MRSSWGSRLSFYIAATGAAFGLGNIWRFPYVVAENGGGAFVLLFVLFAFLLGLPIVIGELILGRSQRRSVVLACDALAARRPSLRGFRYLGRAALLLSLLMVSFYAVISGWVAHFIVQFAVASPTTEPQRFSMSILLESGLLQLALASAHLLLVAVIVVKGVQDGVERWVNGLMPVFALLLGFLTYRALSLDSAQEALRFMFYPDFSRLSYQSLLAVIGHVFFTLSVGFGTLVTFGSYLKDEEQIPSTAFRLTLADIALSLIAALVVFSIALSASDVPLQSPSLLFEALPRFISSVPGGNWLGLLFFSCLYVAALGASIGLFESVVANVMDWFRVDRFQATIGTLFAALLIAVIPAFSTSLDSIQGDLGGPRQHGLLEIFDFVLIAVFLPIIVFFMSLALSRGLHESEQAIEFRDEGVIESESLFSHWQLAIRWGIPLVILLAFALRIFGELV